MTPDERCTNLEIKFLRQEQLLEELSSVLFEQQKLIDNLEKNISSLKKQLETPQLEIGPAHEIPPHY
jgi:SlyX protein